MKEEKNKLNRISEISAQIRTLTTELNDLCNEVLNSDITDYSFNTNLLNGQKDTRISFDEILDVVSRVMRVTVYEVKEKSRKRELVLPRHIFYYLTRKNTKASLSAMSKYFNQDHTTVIHATQTVKDLMENDSDLCNAVSICQKQIEDLKTSKNNQMHL